MKTRFIVAISAICILLGTVRQTTAQTDTYLGFDRNQYPGDATLNTFRQTFSYTGYWLNNPPGASSNSWAGHRVAVESAGFGFLVLFNGRLYAALKSEANAARLGRTDARAAAASAQREGFPRATIIFLDQEQGGRMLPEQKAYIYAWVDGVVAAGFRAGVYCSGMRSTDGQNVVTAEDIRQSASSREITYWVTNDACPPAPGCAFTPHPPSPSQSGVGFAEVWQFAQSPQRKDVARHCTNYSHDGNCYPPGTSASQGFHIDVNTATSPDPSHARTR
ncbi:MAG TPA: glycoside hydrolase domain-containing protein [Candidatus Dormibacteraeota bacterium]|nr:glycoside hydrolase domain-containing protein [Candidatus Dormibacteraeota bacterium]